MSTHRDPASLLEQGREASPRFDVFPGNFLNLFFVVLGQFLNCLQSLAFLFHKYHKRNQLLLFLLLV